MTTIKKIEAYYPIRKATKIIDFNEDARFTHYCLPTTVKLNLTRWEWSLLLSVSVDRRLLESVGRPVLGDLFARRDARVKRLQLWKRIQRGGTQHKEVVEEVEHGVVDETYMITN